jgi:hypothetical protein
MVNGLTLDHVFDFQEQAVLKLIDFTTNSNSKQTIVMKAPTGAGKTIILIDFVVTYMDNVNKNTAFVWLCPGKGDLEEQSRKKMERIAPQRDTQNLFDALQNGFTPESTTFINWELVTKRGNTAIRDSERKNLFDRIAEAHRNHIDFVVIIDEEHSNNTSKAREIIDAFAAKNIIRVSATAIQNKKYEFFEIDEQDVIDAGLITKAIYVNEGIEANTDVGNDYDILLDLADTKRKEIAARYKALGKDIRPLVLIQFPSGQPETDKAYETRRLFLKEKCKTFALPKQIRDLEYHGLGEREVWYKIYDLFMQKYHLSTNPDSAKKFRENADILKGSGYRIGRTLYGQALQGTFVRTDALRDSAAYIQTRQKVDTHKDGIKLLHCTDEIKQTIGMPTAKVKTILERLFRKGRASNKKVLSLETTEFYAFVINNVHLLKEEFREAASQQGERNIQMHMPEPKVSAFHIPEQDFFKYDPGVKEEVEYLSNAYKNYTSGFATSLIRSTPEQLFEQYCESREDIDWVYKNGDSGQQYFSIVYLDSLWHQWLFYADYIVKKKDGTVWVIETKGGEAKGKDKNIDRQIQNKFEAFKTYASRNNLNWGFVRDKDNHLYINNTVFAEDMADEHWQPIADVF